MKLDNKTMAELMQMTSAIESDPANKMPKGSVYLYTKQARTKLDAIARQVTYLLAEKRKAAGNPVPCDGYSGKQSRR
jgi:hypothetical protein